MIGDLSNEENIIKYCLEQNCVMNITAQMDLLNKLNINFEITDQ